MEGMDKDLEEVPVYKETVELDLSGIDPDEFQWDTEAQVALGGYMRMGDICEMRDSSVNAGEPGVPVIDMRFGNVWFLLACLGRLDGFNPDRCEFKFKFDTAPQLVVTVPLRGILGEILVGGYGPMGKVNPENYGCVADLDSSPYSTPVDNGKVIRIGMKELIAKFPEVFDAFDSPDPVRWAAEQFRSAVMDRDTKTLTISLSEFLEFPNHSLRDWNNIRENQLAMGWKVEFTQ